jgi:hypothetical protein
VGEGSRSFLKAGGIARATKHNFDEGVAQTPNTIRPIRRGEGKEESLSHYGDTAEGCKIGGKVLKEDRECDYEGRLPPSRRPIEYEGRLPTSRRPSEYEGRLPPSRRPSVGEKKTVAAREGRGGQKLIGNKLSHTLGESCIRPYTAPVPNSTSINTAPRAADHTGHVWSGPRASDHTGHV